MLNWSAGKIRGIQDWAQCGYPFMALVAQSKLAVLEGDLEKAGRILDEILEKYGEKRQERDFLQHISAVSVIARRLRITERLIAERLAPAWQVEVRLTPSIKNRGAAVRWLLLDHKAMAFEINEDVFASDHTEYYLQSWIYCLPLYAAYTHDPDIQLGWVDINLDDRAAVPGLVGCEVRRDCFLIPDRAFIHWEGYRDIARQYRQDDVPWDERQPIALWRGSTTGIPEDQTVGWRSLPRIRLCQIARSPSSRAMIDTGITAIAQIADPAAADALREAGLMAQQLPAAQFNRYKYQIDIDGNTNSWPGLFYKLLTGSPVLKIASPFGFRQWYYDQLKPWINFLPVASDMSDLVEKVDWLRAHDDAARQIGERGRALAESLDFEGELKRAGRVITAAIRYAARLPESSLAFGIGADGNGCLREGWAEPGDASVPALGTESRIELPRPVSLDDFVLTLDISPFTEAPGSPEQRITVVANGEMLHHAALSTRQVLCCSLPQRVLGTAETLTLTLLHPDSVRAASVARPLDERLLSFTLHAMELVPSTVHGARVKASAQVAESAASIPVEPRSLQIMSEQIDLADIRPQSDLARKTRLALDRAMASDSKITKEILEMSGMSGKKYRHFINNLIESIDDPRYLEVGVYAGSTLCSAIFGNRVTATAIDNWSYEQQPIEALFTNLARFKGPEARVSFLDRDFRQVDFATLGIHDIYLFDGPHAEADQYDGVMIAQPALAQEYVLIVDDWNWAAVRHGTWRAVKELGLGLDVIAEIRTAADGVDPPVAFQFSDWHNGYLIAAVCKNRS